MEFGSSKSAGWAVRLESKKRAAISVEVQKLSTGRIPSCSGEVRLLFYSGL
jgi:hypothetical protein